MASLPPIEAQLLSWLERDEPRMRALRAARELALPQWCLAAGFVRNLVWDQLHGYEASSPLADVDLIFFDPLDVTRAREHELEATLGRLCPGQNWSVKNQARMHLRHGDAPYLSACDAMRYWVEVETAVGVSLRGDGAIEVVQPFGLESLFALHITPNTVRLKPEVFARRLAQKRWLEKWPLLKVVTAS